MLVKGFLKFFRIILFLKIPDSEPPSLALPALKILPFGKNDSFLPVFSTAVKARRGGEALTFST